MSILEATHREAEWSVVVGAHVCIVADEAEVARIGSANRNAPVAAVGSDIDERSIEAAADARYGQFERRSKGPSTIITAPT